MKTNLQSEGFLSWGQAFRIFLLPTAPRNTNNHPALVPHQRTRWCALSASGPSGASTRWCIGGRRPLPLPSSCRSLRRHASHCLSPPPPPAESHMAVSSGPSYITAAINHASLSRGLSLSWGVADMRAATSLSFSQTGLQKCGRLPERPPLPRSTPQTSEIPLCHDYVFNTVASGKVFFETQKLYKSANYGAFPSQILNFSSQSLHAGES